MAFTGNPFLPENDGGSGAGARGGRLKFSVCSGAASASDITLSGLEPEDGIVAVIKFDTGVPSDETANVTTIKEDAFQLSSVTSSKTLFVVWLSRALPWA